MIFPLPSFLPRNFDREFAFYDGLKRGRDVNRDIEDESLKREMMKKRDDKMKLFIE